MPLGDFFAFDPPLLCPLCGGAIAEWDGFGGPGLFLLFRQGESAFSEARLRSHAPAAEVRLPDGEIPLFAECPKHHYLMAEAHVKDGVLLAAALRDVDGSEPLPLAGRFFLWRSRGPRFAISSLTPTATEGVVPASLTAIGVSEACIVATRREDTRDPSSIDEWWLVDVEASKVLGPYQDDALTDVLKERGLTAPDALRLPDEIR